MDIDSLKGHFCGCGIDLFVEEEIVHFSLMIYRWRKALSASDMKPVTFCGRKYLHVVSRIFTLRSANKENSARCVFGEEESCHSNTNDRLTPTTCLTFWLAECIPA